MVQPRSPRILNGTRILGCGSLCIAAGGRQVLNLGKVKKTKAASYDNAFKSVGSRSGPRSVMQGPVTLLLSLREAKQ